MKRLIYFTVSFTRNYRTFLICAVYRVIFLWPLETNVVKVAQLHKCNHVPASEGRIAHFGSKLEYNDTNVQTFIEVALDITLQLHLGCW